MKHRIRFRSIAEEEVAAVAIQYEAEVKGLGSQFLDVIEHTLENISHFPKMYQTIDTEIHRAVVRHFPYHIFYTIDGEDIIILGFRHSHQDPASWPE